MTKVILIILAIVLLAGCIRDAPEILNVEVTSSDMYYVPMSPLLEDVKRLDIQRCQLVVKTQDGRERLYWGDYRADQCPGVGSHLCLNEGKLFPDSFWYHDEIFLEGCTWQ